MQRGNNVVEFALGLGGTASRFISCTPSRYTGIEHDKEAATWTLKHHHILLLRSLFQKFGKNNCMIVNLITRAI